MANIKLRTFKEISTQTAVFKMDIRHTLFTALLLFRAAPGTENIEVHIRLKQHKIDFKTQSN